MSSSFTKRRAALSAPFVALLWLSGRALTAEATVPLTAMDHIQIQQLVNRLNFALDYCSNGGRDFADLFVEGGRFVIDEGNGTPRVFGNREQLIALAGGPDCKANQLPPRSDILHTAESLVIEASPSGAYGTSYAIYPAHKGRYLKEDVAGQVGLYHDEYVRTAAGWRFKARTHETSPAIGGKSPLSVPPDR
jgi:SnoaL-like domain